MLYRIKKEAQNNWRVRTALPMALAAAETVQSQLENKYHPNNRCSFLKKAAGWKWVRRDPSLASPVVET